MEVATGSRPITLRKYLIPLLAVVTVAGLAVVRSVNGGEPEVAASRPTVQAASIPALDDVTPMPADVRPKSPQAVGGMLFVRCTHLWAALPDGSEAHLLLSKAGLASPTFAPDGKTIAFLAQGTTGPEIWMAAADGSTMTEVGALSSAGVPIGAAASSLQWSPDSQTLAFALSTPGDPWGMGSAIWELNVAAGTFSRIASGVTDPAWVGKRLVAVSGADGTPDFIILGTFDGNNGANIVAKRLSSPTDDVSVGVPPVHWYGVGSEIAATVVRGTDGTLALALRKSPWNGKPYATEAAPAGERLDPASRPAVSGDGTFVSIALIGADGGRDLGMFDTLTNKWTVKDYAWDPAFSPATPALATTQLWRASNIARAFLESRSGGRSDSRLFLDSGVRHADLAFTGEIGQTLAAPRRTAGGWSVPATVFGQHGNGFAYRDLNISVRPQAGRMVVEVARASGLRRIRTIPDAVRFLRRTLTVQVTAPMGLPPGASLATTHPVSAWSWNDRTTGSLRIQVPFTGNGRSTLTFGYDDGGFGCGSSSVPTDIAGTQGDVVRNAAIAQGSMPEVIWPAKPGASSAPFSIAGDLPRRVLLKIASATEAARR